LLIKKSILTALSNHPLHLNDMAAQIEEYDFIVIGGGTSGLVVAARLTKNPEISVLILEAGGNYLQDPRVQVPAGWRSLIGSDADWGFKTSPQVSH
jgi:choline dehydrogenase-like flavoprotein